MNDPEVPGTRVDDCEIGDVPLVRGYLAAMPGKY